MLASAYDWSRGFRGESVAVMGFPDSDPTDGEAESAPRIAEPERRLFFAVLTDAIVRVRQLATVVGNTPVTSSSKRCAGFAPTTSPGRVRSSTCAWPSTSPTSRSGAPC